MLPHVHQMRTQPGKIFSDGTSLVVGGVGFEILAEQAAPVGLTAFAVVPQCQYSTILAPDAR